MTPPGPGRLPPADEPLDDADFGVLGDIRELFEAVDPMPADLPERIRFALALRDLEVEVARLAEEDQLTVAARGKEQARTITFDSDSLTIMIRIDANLDGTVDSMDFARLAGHFGNTGEIWSSGDFNFDGLVDTVDFNFLAGNFGQTIAPAGGAPGAALGGSIGTLVPEPSSLLLIGFGAGSLLSRRRRIC